MRMFKSAGIGFLAVAILGVTAINAADDKNVADARKGNSTVENVIVNGGFEDSPKDGKMASWAMNSYPEPNCQPMLACSCLSKEKVHSGENSLKIDFQNIKEDVFAKANQITLDQNLDTETVKRLCGKKVILSAWLNYEYLDEESKGAHYFPGPCFTIRVYGKSGALSPTDKKVPVMLINHASMAKYGVNSSSCIGKWIRVEQEGWIPEEAEMINIHIDAVAKNLKVQNPNATCVYIDDIRLEPVAE